MTSEACSFSEEEQFSRAADSTVTPSRTCLKGAELTSVPRETHTGSSTIQHHSRVDVRFFTFGRCVKCKSRLLLS